MRATPWISSPSSGMLSTNSLITSAEFFFAMVLASLNPLTIILALFAAGPSEFFNGSSFLFSRPHNILLPMIGPTGLVMSTRFSSIFSEGGGSSIMSNVAVFLSKQCTAIFTPKSKLKMADTRLLSRIEPHPTALSSSR